MILTDRVSRYLRRIPTSPAVIARNASLRTIGLLGRFEPSRAMVICSEPRGGSTWITEVLSRQSRRAVLLEPLHQHWEPRVRQLGMNWHQHIPESAQWPEVRDFFEQIFRGQRLRPSMCTHSALADYLTADRLIVKFVRANALLPWMVRNFHFELQPIYLVRHPLAVVASQLRHPNWSKVGDRFGIPPDRHPELYEPHRSFLAGLRGRAEVLLAQWCLRNQYLLRHPDNDKAWITVHYEDLLLNPETKLREIADRWGLTFEPAVYAAVNRPSSSSIDFDPQSQEQVGKWRSKFTDVEMARFLQILDYFEIDSYGQSPQPLAGKRRN